MNLSFILSMILNSFTLKSVSPESGGRPLTVRFFFFFCAFQTWHKACFHCEVCKMMLSVNNFVSHQKKPYCHA